MFKHRVKCTFQSLSFLGLKGKLLASGNLGIIFFKQCEILRKLLTCSGLNIYFALDLGQ